MNAQTFILPQQSVLNFIYSYTCIDINYIPVSGLTDANLKVPFTDDCSWYKYV